MQPIYHIVLPSAWHATSSEPYRADSLATEGFIHCSYRSQVAWVANQFYRDQTDLAVLAIDADQLTSPVKAEDPGCGQRFPHVYGPIERAAVIGIHPLQRDAAGNWVLEDGD